MRSECTEKPGAWQSGKAWTARAVRKMLPEPHGIPWHRQGLAPPVPGEHHCGRPADLLALSSTLRTCSTVTPFCQNQLIMKIFPR